MNIVIYGAQVNVSKQLVHELLELVLESAAMMEHCTDPLTLHDRRAAVTDDCQNIVRAFGLGHLVEPAARTLALVDTRTADQPAPLVPPAPIEQTPGMYRTEIAYDLLTHDYAMYLDGELVGFGRTYHEAETVLDQLGIALRTGCYFRENA